MASVQNPLNISADEVSMNFPLTAENAAEIRRLDGLYKEASSNMSPKNTYEWKPALKDDEDVAKVYFVLKGPTATRMTVMEGTKIIDSGTGMSFLEKNYRFLECMPEIDIRRVPWLLRMLCFDIAPLLLHSKWNCCSSKSSSLDS